MYISPIEIAIRDVQADIERQTEDLVFSTIRKCDVKVDKEELVKALNYDRAQYTKGYNDGIVKAIQIINECVYDITKMLNKMKEELNEEGKGRL